ncbi:hypothetical protein [Phenylobacterium sp.]|jgi:hypothetical protein|uniref:hypothetical protein n=1 Tax=Phenylobacterium sp. TaxID=1871053 RepID=UPI0025D4004F|nr:hypothetical protein [Phenylobacterium sp.]MCA6286251.1 hypothetical protein [Phenylobacterium sp.]MCA6289026.1 hypothetical protein [Phenylobacterium sp.]MCA6311496.1 hypothetical protein [Phenylobacterium sp.]MCA6324217.1 hypothetical protein [Phenylobacterium sp.]MCA6338362.1 hypothetical protein [Phenylobacterium sp.]
MTLRLPRWIRRPLAILAAGSALALASCDQPKPAAPAASEAPAGKVRPPRAPEPISWNPELKAFVLDGAPLKTLAQWTFEAGTDGFEGAGSTLAARPGGGLDVTGDLFDPIVRFPKDLSVKGSESNAVLVRITRNKDTERWDGSLFWTTAAHGEAAGFATKPIRGADPAVGETTIMVYDLAKPRKGGDDWLKSVITGIRLDLDDSAGGAFTLQQVAIVTIPGGATPEAATPEAAAVPAKAPTAP